MLVLDCLGWDHVDPDSKWRQSVAIYARQVAASEVPPALPRGRVRTPSRFDNQVRFAYRAWIRDPDVSWFAVPYRSLEELDHLKRELDRAVKYIGKGRLIRVGPDDNGIPTMWYQVRDRQQRRTHNR